MSVSIRYIDTLKDFLKSECNEHSLFEVIDISREPDLDELANEVYDVTFELHNGYRRIVRFKAESDKLFVNTWEGCYERIETSDWRIKWFYIVLLFEN